uniref:Uncharacterized protein n=1 Tax=Kalanchoe fedtschenkoi TaxID=63787 RepID=A0A7N0VJC7_KALFE
MGKLSTKTLPAMLECSYCSTPVRSNLDDTTILDCSFCGKVISEVDFIQEFHTLLKRKSREPRKRRRKEVECEQSCVTTAPQSDISDSDSTASSKPNNSKIATDADGTKNPKIRGSR